jgi:hypothetical protein
VQGYNLKNVLCSGLVQQTLFTADADMSDRICVQLSDFRYVEALRGARGSAVFKALCCKPEGRGFETRLEEFLNVSNPSGRSRPWGLLSL